MIATPLMISSSQTALVEALIAEAIADPATREHRWAKASPWALTYAQRGLLLLTRDWVEDTVMSAQGKVFVVDTDGGAADRDATEREARTSLFRSLRRYPELLTLLPPRPASAVVCMSCEGTGVLLLKFTSPILASVACVCGGAGWLPAAEKTSE